jgi:hypothetical protein
MSSILLLPSEAQLNLCCLFLLAQSTLHSPSCLDTYSARLREQVDTLHVSVSLMPEILLATA